MGRSHFYTPGFSENIEESNNRPVQKSTACMLPILHKIREFVKYMVVEYNNHIPNFQCQGDEEDKPEEERNKKFKTSDKESHSDSEVEPKKLYDNDNGLHLLPPPVPKEAMMLVDTKKVFQSKL